MTSGIWRTQRWKGLTMEDVYLTNRDYVKIKNLNLVSYGGNQNWSKSKKMQKVGCGVIAMADLTMYLAEQNPNMMTDAIRKINKPKGLYNKHDYLEYVRFFYVHYMILLMHKGMLGITLKHTMNRYFMLNDIGLKAKWKMMQSDESMLRDIRHLIRKNKPVILAIGPNRYNPFGKKGISLYVDKDGELKSSIRENVHSHYVTVTGVCTIKGREYLVVSSWGKKYYIDYKEYRNYVNNVGDKFTSGILYIQGLL